MNKKTLFRLLALLQGDFAWCAIGAFSIAYSWHRVSLNTMTTVTVIYLPIAVVCTLYLLTNEKFKAEFFRILGKYFMFPVPKQYRE